MIYEREKIAEIYDLLTPKTDYSYFLLVCTFQPFSHPLTKNEYILGTVRWKNKVKDWIHPDDMACVVNSGNIFVIVHNHRKKSFLDELSENTTIFSKKYSVYSEALELTNNEIHILANQFFRYRGGIWQT